MPMMLISKQEKKEMATQQQQRRRSFTLRGLLNRLDGWPDGGDGRCLLFWSGELVEEGVEREARSKVVHTRKDELGKCLDDLLPFAHGALDEQIRQGFEGEARSKVVHARKDELSECLDDLLPFAHGALCEQIW